MIGPSSIRVGHSAMLAIVLSLSLVAVLKIDLFLLDWLPRRGCRRYVVDPTLWHHEIGLGTPVAYRSCGLCSD